jgi:hypothetical protein
MYIQAMEDIRYPVGKFTFDKDSTPQKRAAWAADIAELPARVQAAVAGLSAAQLDTAYREGGWTPRQVVHHLADSHMNAFIRFKLALTENAPQIKPYDQKAWAELGDGRSADVGYSLSLLQGLHARWSALLSSLSADQLDRVFMHPESGPQTLDRTLQVYAWHCRHHVAHITGLRSRNGW